MLRKYFIADCFNAVCAHKAGISVTGVGQRLKEVRLSTLCFQRRGGGVKPKTASVDGLHVVGWGERGGLRVQTH